MYGYKGFTSKLTGMNNFQYEVGKRYKIDEKELKMCQAGFHFCQYPMDVLNYYFGQHCVYAKVRADGKVIFDEDKAVTNEIAIVQLITREQLMADMNGLIVRPSGKKEWFGEKTKVDEAMDLSIFDNRHAKMHSLAYVESTDHVYDEGHNSQHCLRVNQTIQQHYCHTGTLFTEESERRILTFSAYFHEQDDDKFKVNMNHNKLREIMTLDHVPSDEQEVVLSLISICSFKKRKLVPANYPWIGLLNLLSSADLAEAVGEQSLTRSFKFHKKRLEREGVEREQSGPVSEREVWSHVLQFYLSEIDGYYPRLEAITIQSIRDMVEPFVVYNKVQASQIQAMLQLD